MEIRYGILQVAEALFYLHTTERLLHLNVCPQNVIVTKRGTWKLTGLCFTQSIGADAQSNVRTTRHCCNQNCGDQILRLMHGDSIVSLSRELDDKKLVCC